MPELLLLAASPFAGSLIACLAWRMPRGMNWLSARSCCDSCQVQLSWAELVPIFSYAWQRGRCRHCRERIPALWLQAELAALVAAGLTIWRLDWPHALFASLLIWAGMFLLIRHDQHPRRRSRR